MKKSFKRLLIITGIILFATNPTQGQTQDMTDEELREFYKSQGVTPLMFAAADCNVEEIKSLLEAGADVNAENKSGETAWYFANEMSLDENCQTFHRGCRNCKKVTSLLAEKMLEGATPLMLAIIEGHEATIEKLLESGADAGTKDSNGKTALDHANKHKRKDIIELIGIYKLKNTLQKAIKQGKPFDCAWFVNDRSLKALKRAEAAHMCETCYDWFKSDDRFEPEAYKAAVDICDKLLYKEEL